MKMPDPHEWQFFDAFNAPQLASGHPQIRIPLQNCPSCSIFDINHKLGDEDDDDKNTPITSPITTKKVLALPSASASLLGPLVLGPPCGFPLQVLNPNLCSSYI
jgi:hypothetical protein